MNQNFRVIIFTLFVNFDLSPDGVKNYEAAQKHLEEIVAKRKISNKSIKIIFSASGN
jgi:hypothetical protein